MDAFKKRTNTGSVYYDFDTRLQKSWAAFQPTYIKTTDAQPANRRFILAVIFLLTFTAWDAWNAWPATPPEPCGDGDTFVKLGWGDWRLCDEPPGGSTNVLVVYARPGGGVTWLCENEEGDSWTTRAPVTVKYQNRTARTHQYKVLTERAEACAWTYMEAH